MTINTAAIIGNNVMIEKEAFIGHQAKIHDNVVIGSEAFVGENVDVRVGRKVESGSITYNHGYIAPLRFSGFREVFEKTEFFRKVARNFLIGSFSWLANDDEYEMFTSLYMKLDQ